MPDVNKGAGLFHERLGGGFRKGLVVSGKSGVVPGKAAWFQGRLRGGRKDWVLVCGKAGWFQERLGGFRKAGRFQERLGGFRLGGGFSKDRVVVLAVSRKQAGWFQERLGAGFRCGFRRRRVVSGRAVWFTAKLCCFTKVCVPYDVHMMLEVSWFRG